MSMELDEVKQRMQSKKLYFCSDKRLVSEQTERFEMLYDYNQSRPSENQKREELLKKMFAEIGEDCYIEQPFYANWSGKFVHFGKSVYANFGLTMVDDTDIFVGDFVMFGPNVTIVAGTHPIHPELRKNKVQYNSSVKIGNNVWVGANSVILPGVTIGENSIIGAGSVVSRDIPPNVVAVGSPCRVMREICEDDLKYYNKNMEIDLYL